jgi:hypothetical protein
VVYDMTIAFPGYTGQMPSSVDSNLDTFLRFCNGEGPREIHIRLKRYQMVSAHATYLGARGFPGSQLKGTIKGPYHDPCYPQGASSLWSGRGLSWSSALR